MARFRSGTAVPGAGWMDAVPAVDDAVFLPPDIMLAVVPAIAACVFFIGQLNHLKYILTQFVSKVNERIFIGYTYDGDNR